MKTIIAYLVLSAVLLVAALVFPARAGFFIITALLVLNCGLVWGVMRK